MSYGTNSYEYNADGQRTSKTVGGVKTEFFYNGSILAGQKCGNDTLIFMYDNNGDSFGFTYNGTEYYYVKNAQNDVIAVANANGTIVAKYTYDAWGKTISITDANGNVAPQNSIGNINPIRYRSYYFDAETNLYHLNTRYYSPIMCRFLNADGIAQTGQGMLDKNMFAYCMNNPVNMIDSSGMFGKKIKELWNSFTNWLFGEPDVQSINERDSNILSYAEKGENIYDNFSNANNNVANEIKTAAENLVNMNSGKSGVSRKPQANKKLDKKINSTSKASKMAYAKLVSYIPLMPNGMDISGKTWNEIDVKCREMIVEYYVMWDPITVQKIGYVYGVDITTDLMKDVMTGGGVAVW